MITWTETSRACPSPESLRSYADGWVDEASVQKIEEHLSQCDACSRSIELGTDPSDEWLQAIRTKPAPSPIAQHDSASSKNSIVEETSEGIDPLVQQAIESSKRILDTNSSMAIPQRETGFSGTLGLIGPYELLRPIGQGGMGYVMLARHKHLNKEVALKILPRTPWRIPSEEARFQREVRAVGKLEHPSIVTALDAGEYQGTQFLAMAYVDGLDLSRLAKASGPLSISDACELIRQTALGLSYAHAQGVVHRDIKPSNLMLDRSGKVKILDFGLAQLQPWDDGCADLTSVGQLMGTLDFMAPEQAEHGGAVSYLADIYSLGATLFRLLVGRAPLAITPTQTPIEKLRLLANHPIPRLKTMLPNAPDALCSIVDSLLSRDPSQRPPSASHLAEMLEPWAKGSELVPLLNRAQDLASQMQDSTASQPKPLVSIRDSISSNTDATQLPSSQSVRGRSRWNWIPWTVAGLLGPLAAFGGFLIYLETQKGQVVVESEVADVRVKVVSDGKDVEDVQLSQGTNSIRLRAGKYELLIDSPTDSVTMSNHAFVLKKGETVVARIRRAEPSAAQTQLNTASSPTSSDPFARPVDELASSVPQYDGKSLDQWLAILDRERAFDRVMECLSAILALASREDRDKIRKPVDDHLQRNLESPSFISETLRIEKRILTDIELQNRLNAVLKKAPESTLVELIKGRLLEETIGRNRMFAESLMSLELNQQNQRLAEVVALKLSDIILNASDLGNEELKRYCDRAFGCEVARKQLVDPTTTKRVEVLQVLDSLVVRTLQSAETMPQEKADAMSYLLNPESLARLKKEAVAAIEKELVAMTNDSQLRVADTEWRRTSNRLVDTSGDRSKEYNSMFVSRDLNKIAQRVPYGIFILRFISPANLSKELAESLRGLAKSCLNSIQPIAPELLALRFDSINVDAWEANVGIHTLKSKSNAWKKEFFTFHAAMRLLQSHKLATAKDFCPEATMTIDMNLWVNAYLKTRDMDSDRSGDLDPSELHNSYDFTSTDQNGDGFVSEVELYYSEVAFEKQQQLVQKAKQELSTLVEALKVYQLQVGSLPITLRALWERPADVHENLWTPSRKSPIEVDPWGTPYQYKKYGTKFELRSFGPDRQEDTEDDINTQKENP